MKLLDTVVIIGSLDRTSKLHHRCMEHLDSVQEEGGTLVPAVAILEADLVMKSRNYRFEERRVSWHALEYKIPTSKILANSISSIRTALNLQEKGMDYFDSLISSLAIEHKATVVTTDHVIGRSVAAEW